MMEGKNLGTPCKVEYRPAMVCLPWFVLLPRCFVLWHIENKCPRVCVCYCVHVHIHTLLYQNSDTHSVEHFMKNQLDASS